MTGQAEHLPDKVLERETQRQAAPSGGCSRGPASGLASVAIWMTYTDVLSYLFNMDCFLHSTSHRCHCIPILQKLDLQRLIGHRNGVESLTEEPWLLTVEQRARELGVMEGRHLRARSTFLT